MTYFVAQLSDGLRLTGVAVAAYFGSGIFIGLALIPAALRTHQLFARNNNGWLEIVVELFRLALVAAMIILGRNWGASDFFRGSRWAEVGSGIADAWRNGWPCILIQLALVTALILAFTAAFEVFVTASHTENLLSAVKLGTDHAEAFTSVVIFAVKNFVVIPVYLIAMLQALGITHYG